MNKRWINGTVMGSLVLALSGLTWAGLTWADGDAKDHPGGPHGGRGAMAQHWFERLDANKDGQLTRQEAEAGSLRLFERLDANKDGVLTREEAEAGARAIRDEELSSRFRELDANKDGRLTADESKLPPRFFDRVDSNHDHALSLQEFLAMPDFGNKRRGFEFDRADANHDGKVTRAEAEQAGKQRFDRVDANHDGVITHEELAQHLAQMGHAHDHEGGAEH
jgi:Ca2+-binding EF-hand superfamily protein